MPQKSGFFDTTADDPREYSAHEFADYFSKFIGNGVFSNSDTSGGDKLKVTCTGRDMNVSVSLGCGWINGYMYSVYDAPVVLPIQIATTYNRIDRIVLRLDTSMPVRSIRVLVLQGNPATLPTAPALVRSGNIYDLSLAQVLVKANTSTIQTNQITDERINNQVCGIVATLLTPSHLMKPPERITPTLPNGWRSESGSIPISYYKDVSGTVHLIGRAAHGRRESFRTLLFTLPAGYRPPGDLLFPMQVEEGEASLSVSRDGAVSVALTGHPPRFAIVGVSFPTF